MECMCTKFGRFYSDAIRRKPVHTGYNAVYQLQMSLRKGTIRGGLIGILTSFLLDLNLNVVLNQKNYLTISEWLQWKLRSLIIYPLVNKNRQAYRGTIFYNFHWLRLNVSTYLFELESCYDVRLLFNYQISNISCNLPLI